MWTLVELGLVGQGQRLLGLRGLLDELDEAALLRRDGIAVVYIPLAPNVRRAPGFDPTSISTWRREVSEEESQALLATAEVSSPPYSNSIRSAYILGRLTYLFTGQL